ncbi:MAG: anaerobic ribonucleoside-triphosphate reductase activating protein [Planctomycetota bacterium]|nr:anaerobic ribonucleoside-triphosphate reductase activating protein [Planctomycetota bacterium]
MKIGGLMPFTLSDFPGRAAAVIFTQGCNFRCPFCHNGSLIPREVGGENLISEERVLEFLASRRGRLDGVVISGGEPTIQPDLPDFLRRLKDMGFAVKLDTNGSMPNVIERLIGERLVDYVAMDVKGSLHAYGRIAGIPVAVAKIIESIHLIAGSGVAHEFRTTVVWPLLDDADIREIRQLIPAPSPHRLQEFRPENALDPSLREPPAVATALGTRTQNAAGSVAAKHPGAAGADATGLAAS